MLRFICHLSALSIPYAVYAAEDDMDIAFTGPKITAMEKTDYANLGNDVRKIAVAGMIYNSSISIGYVSAASATIATAIWPPPSAAMLAGHAGDER